MKRWLLQLAWAVIRRWDPDIWIPLPSGPEVNRARELTEEFDSSPNSGEWKRHQVYARLIKEFPAVSRRKLGWLIEAVLQEEI